MIFLNGYYYYNLIKDIGKKKMKNKNLLFLTVILLYQSVLNYIIAIKLIPK
jgi:hypothetical protein